MAAPNQTLKLRLFCHALAALPLAYLLYLIIRTLNGDLFALGADPSETMMSYLGAWGLRMLLVTLAVTPIQRIWPRSSVIRCRRALGLWSFTYLGLHLSFYVIGINGFDFVALLEDLVERPFILTGMLGLTLMVPLAVTSTKGWQARLGAKWRKLHRLIYVIVALGILHFFLQVRHDHGEFVLFAIITTALLGYRVNVWLKQKRKT